MCKKTLLAAGASDGGGRREHRERILSAVAELVPQLPTRRALRACGAAHATWYRRRAAPPQRAARARPPPPLALSSTERALIVDTLNSPRFADVTPYTAWARLLDEGVYLASVRTFYRVLAASGLVRERRDQLVHPTHTKPELIATAPNQVWSWDITRLRSSLKWHFFYLYVLLDIYSRYVVGWLLADAENAGLASALIDETCTRHGIDRGQLTLHSDRGSPMRAKTTAELLVDLGVAASYSRPRVSNDNPFSEAQFKTLKYRPDFPLRFDGIDQARVHLRSFFTWYNDEHRHSDIGFMTPAAVHFGHAADIEIRRRVTLQAAFAAHPARFKQRLPMPPTLPEVVGINLPPLQPKETTTHDLTTLAH
jgi:putative transposase